VLKLTKRRLLYLSAFSLMGIGLGMGSAYSETRKIEITRLNLGIGSKIAFLVDSHIHAFDEVEQRVIGLVNDEEPDVILLGGDVIDELTTDTKAVAQYISGLKASEKYAVMGNHDYWSGRAEELVRILEDHGFSILYGSTASSSAGKFYGLDWKEDRKYAYLKAEGIVLVHDPNCAPSISGKCLILSGHTHGGLMVANQTLYSNSIYTRGFYYLKEGNILYVSRGLGQMIPLRPTSPLELVIIK
jgi:predicted MPP superfamily phosphohydrolase